MRTSSIATCALSQLRHAPLVNVGEASERLATIGAPEGQQALSPGQAQRRPGYNAHILVIRPARAKA